MLHGGLGGARPLSFPGGQPGWTEIQTRARMKSGTELGYPCGWARVKGSIWRGRLVLSVARPVPLPNTISWPKADWLPPEETGARRLSV